MDVLEPLYKAPPRSEEDSEFLRTSSAVDSPGEPLFS